MTPRDLSRSLGGYLCGTHARIWPGRRARPFGPGVIADLIHTFGDSLSRPDDQTATILGGQRWEPDEEQRELADALSASLRTPKVIDLVVFGSQARGGRTGFSDVDAILVIPDAVAGDERRLRALRKHVLAAQRAVVDHQPMQHHGFEVVTPTLLRHPSTLGMPAEAFQTTRSLYGQSITSAMPSVAHDLCAAYRQLVSTLIAVEQWPRHPWTLHRVVSMFELVPAVYLQATGRFTPKHRSFELVSAELPDVWHPYDVLATVRKRWRRRPRPALEAATRACRNPWLAVSLWRRVPTSTPGEVKDLLTDTFLQDLRRVLLRMSERVASIPVGPSERLPADAGVAGEALETRR